MHSIFWRIRLIILPISSAFIVCAFALQEWSRINELDRKSAAFHQSSEIVTFTATAPLEENDREYPVYEYMVNGEPKEFTTLRKINLPKDGRVRIGLDPFFKAGRFSDRVAREVVVPVTSSDSINDVYLEFRGHERERDVFRATAISIAALIVGIAAFFLQKIIFRALTKNKPRRY